jgi:hypothetical protein
MSLFTHCNSFFVPRSQLLCSIEDGLLKAQGVGSTDFYNDYALHYVASGSNATYRFFVPPFHIGCNGIHCIEEIGS